MSPLQVQYLLLTDIGTSRNVGWWIRNPSPFGTNQKSRTVVVVALMFTGDGIKRPLGSKHRRDEKKDETWLVPSTKIEYRTDHTRFAKSRYTQDNKYGRTILTLEGCVSNLSKKHSRYAHVYQKF